MQNARDSEKTVGLGKGRTKEEPSLAAGKQCTMSYGLLSEERGVKLMDYLIDEIELLKEGASALQHKV